MGLFGGMKDKLGFGGKPEWQDDDFEEDEHAARDDRAETREDGTESQERATRRFSGSVVDFDAYNPANFENVTLDSDRTLQVASYDPADSPRPSARTSRLSSLDSSYTAMRSTGSVASSSRVGSGSGDDAAADGWSTPADPAFLSAASSDAPSARDAHEPSAFSHASSDSYASLGSDFMRMHDNPATHLEIVAPSHYADVERIANAAKAGKSIVLDVSKTDTPLAKRILDFTFGAASALNLNVDKAAERIFVISKGSEMLSAAERDYLRQKGILK